MNGAAYSLGRSIQYNVNFVVHSPSHSLRAVGSEYELDRYQLAKDRGFYTEIKNEESLVTTLSIILRIMDHRRLQVAREPIWSVFVCPLMSNL